METNHLKTLTGHSVNMEFFFEKSKFFFSEFFPIIVNSASFKIDSK